MFDGPILPLRRMSAIILRFVPGLSMGKGFNELKDKRPSDAVPDDAVVQQFLLEIWCENVGPISTTTCRRTGRAGFPESVLENVRMEMARGYARHQS